MIGSNSKVFDEYTVLGRIKYRVCYGYAQPAVVGTYWPEIRNKCLRHKSFLNLYILMAFIGENITVFYPTYFLELNISNT